MKIYLLDINKKITDAWRKYFHNCDDVEIINDNFKNFMDNHHNIEAVVSPSNSFGLMDGGYDKAIIDYFGKDLMRIVQGRIIHFWYGEQPVGTSMTVSTNHMILNEDGEYDYTFLIHTPTMRTPGKITDYSIVYQCMRTCLISANIAEVNSIVIPAFGGATGGVPCGVIARMMFLAYQQIQQIYDDTPDELTWEYAQQIEDILRY